MPPPLGCFTRRWPSNGSHGFASKLTASSSCRVFAHPFLWVQFFFSSFSRGLPAEVRTDLMSRLPANLPSFLTAPALNEGLAAHLPQEAKTREKYFIKYVFPFLLWTDSPLNRFSVSEPKMTWVRPSRP